MGNDCVTGTAPGGYPPPEPPIRVNSRAVRNIAINPVLNGFIVAVGCQTVVFKSDTELLLALAEYLKNPSKVEDEYISKGR